MTSEEAIGAIALRHGLDTHYGDYPSVTLDVQQNNPPDFACVVFGSGQAQRLVVLFAPRVWYTQVAEQAKITAGYPDATYYWYGKGAFAPVSRVAAFRNLLISCLGKLPAEKVQEPGFEQRRAALLEQIV